MSAMCIQGGPGVGSTARRRRRPTGCDVLSLIALMIAVLSAEASVAACVGQDRSPPTSRPFVGPPAGGADGGTEVPVGEASGLLTWHDNLTDAYDEARRTGSPVLVRAGASWCGWCRRLDKEIAAETVQQSLGRWTRVYLDVDRARREAAALNIGPIPALRLLTATGRVVASRDGFMTAEDLVAWLGEHHDRATTVPQRDLTGDGKPGATTVVRLVHEFNRQEASLREAAIRRVLPYPDVAAPLVVDSLAKGDLASRLSALEALTHWKAPVDGIDPWRPETVSDTRLDILKRWIGTLATSEEAPAGDLTPEALAAADREIDRLLVASSEREVSAIRERLARHRGRLLPTVYERLERAVTDRNTERLRSLRYRLAASDALALGWLGGLERLSSVDPQTRQRAAQELAKRATGADKALLLELFADPEPLVREISLRTLQSLGGSDSRAALAKLLRDPDANVRAAVLKILAEKPDARMVSKIAEYVENESDTALVVHAVRFLREAKGASAVKCLTGLLSHENWTVRAEAAEALGQMLSMSSGTPSDAKADAYAALIERLDDEDGFVVSRALASLAGGNMSSMIKADRVRALIEKHPELAAEATRILTGGASLTGAYPLLNSPFSAQLFSSNRRSVNAETVSLLRDLCGNEHSEVRAAALEGLCATKPDDSAEELRAGLGDSVGSVRIVAARALMRIITLKRPVDRSLARGAFYPAEAEPEKRSFLSRLFGGGRRRTTTRPAKVDSKPTTRKTPAEWLTRFKAGDGRPAWMNDLIEPLEAMLRNDSAEERLSAALPLLALGRDIKALPVLMKVIETEASLTEQAAGALPWLLPADRRRLYDTLVSKDLSTSRVLYIAGGIAGSRDEFSEDLLWGLLDREDTTAEQAAGVYTVLLQYHLGERFYDASNLPSKTRKHVAAIARSKAEAGPEFQRLVGLVLLATVAPKEAREVARGIYEDQKANGPLRADALQILLLTLSKTKARSAALNAIGDAAAEPRKRALAYLAGDANAMRALRNNQFPLYASLPGMSNLYSSYGSGSAISVRPPRGLTVEQIKPLLASPDAETSAYAGYFLVLLGDSAGLDRLVAHWRARDDTDETWRRLVYRAISVLNGDQHVATLREIYGRFDSTDYNLREFYWTIRSMKGEQVRKLRSRIRKEVGMDRLR